jgi:hypothetical protein
MIYIKVSFPALNIKFYLSVVALQTRDLKLPVKPQWKLHILLGVILKIGRFCVWVFFCESQNKQRPFPYTALMKGCL